MIHIYRNRESLSIAAAEVFIQCAVQAVKQTGRFSVALSGGHTPTRTFELLAHPPMRDQVDWNRTTIFWSDERCVPLKDPRSNAGIAFKIFLNHVPVPSGQIYPIRCDTSAADAATAYEAILKTHFLNQPVRFDLILLGLGENGHTASLFPHTSALIAKESLVSAVKVAQEGFERVTLTAKVINNALKVVFLVSGSSKASVLSSVIRGPDDPFQLPAQLIQPVAGELLWLVDRDAASQLKDPGEFCAKDDDW